MFTKKKCNPSNKTKYSCLDITLLNKIAKILNINQKVKPKNLYKLINNKIKKNK